MDHADQSDSSDDHDYEEFARGGDRSLTEKENLEMVYLAHNNNYYRAN